MRLLTSTLCATLALAAGISQAAPAASPGTPGILTKGTAIRLRLETDLQGGQSKPGDPVQFTVDRDVYGFGHTLLLTKGMTGTGKVLASTAHDLFGRRGRLTFVCSTVAAAGGVPVPVTLIVGSGSGAAADAADEMDAQVFNFGRLVPLDPDGYVQSASSDGYYVQHTGLIETRIYDPARLFGGLKVTADRGQTYTAHVTNAVSVPVAQR